MPPVMGRCSTVTPGGSRTIFASLITYLLEDTTNGEVRSGAGWYCWRSSLSALAHMGQGELIAPSLLNAHTARALLPHDTNKHHVLPRTGCTPHRHTAP